MDIRGFIYGWRGSLVWWFTNSFLSHFPSKHIRYVGLRLLGMGLSKNVRLYDGFHIRNPHGIIIEDGVSIGPNVLLDGRRGLVIKANAVIAYEAIIWTLNHDYNDTGFCGKGSSVIVGPYAWVCCRSVILPGVSIGEGAIVASGAVVTKDVEPYTIVGGIPAKKIGMRERNNYTYGYKANKDFTHIN